ncbi:MAG: amino acid racemase, partial [Chloroflexota bacterium]|nr:amino acid racemase [Chloroflexota bacterium]
TIPLLHIADAAADAIKAAGLTKVGLLGTRFTMEGAFYRDRLEVEHGLQVMIPGEEDMEKVHRIIYDELVQGQIKESSRRVFQDVIARLQDQGAQGVILGCTEIPLLVRGSDVAISVFDTTTIHAEAAVDCALEEGSPMVS